MVLLANLFPVAVVVILLIYSVRMPLQKLAGFESLSKLWLIYVVLVTVIPGGVLLLLSTGGLRETYLFYRHSYFRWLFIHGQVAGTTFLIPLVQ